MCIRRLGPLAALLALLSVAPAAAQTRIQPAVFEVSDVLASSRGAFYAEAMAAMPGAAAIEVPVINDHRSLIGQAADETKGIPTDVTLTRQCREHVMYIDWTAGLTAGAVTIDTAHDANYQGEWATLGSEVTFSGTAPKQTVVNFTGMYRALRARISAAADAPVNVWFDCN